MSKTNLPETPKTEEIDIIQMFNLIGNAFKSFFNFIYGILEYIFKLFILFSLFIKKNLIKLAIAAVVGFIAGTVADMISKPYYSSILTVRPNYGTNSQLIQNIRLYSQLAMQKDTVTLSNFLGVSPEAAASIHSISILPKSTINDNLLAFDNFVKDRDTLALKNVTFEDFQNNLDVTGFSTYFITVNSDSQDIFKKIEKKLTDIPIPEYFEEQQKIELENIETRRLNIKASLVKIDSLRKDYREIMLLDVDASGKKQTPPSGNNIYLASDSQRPTKEIELFGMENRLNAELIELNQRRILKESFINITSSFPESGFYIKNVRRHWYIIGAIGLAILFLLVVEFNKFLTKYEKKIKGDA